MPEVRNARLTPQRKQPAPARAAREKKPEPESAGAAARYNLHSGRSIIPREATIGQALAGFGSKTVHVQ